MLKKKLSKLKINPKYLHVVIIIIGIIFIALPIFHSNLWFDEAYSVSLANRSFSDIWKIGGHDVHPILYYWILHILKIVFGSKIVLYRIFSLVCTSILGLIGFTHIRKDFGENVGLLFSFLVFFLPINLVYAGEIRMYSLAMLLVTVTAIYAYRIYVNHKNTNTKNWIFFSIFSLSSAYTHYYALIAVVIINLLLMIYFIKQFCNNKNVINLKKFIICGLIQIGLYSPWITYLFIQIKGVSDEFWIGIAFPDTLIEFFVFQFTGNLFNTKNITTQIEIIYSLIMTIYLVVLSILYTKNNDYRSIKKTYKRVKPELIAITIYVIVILVACVISIIIKKPIIHARYMLCITGLFIFFISYTITKKGNKYINVIICIFSLTISSLVNLNLIKKNYDNSNQKPFEYIENEIKNTDVIIYGNEGSGFIISTKFPENKTYFLNEKNWKTEEEFQAFGKQFETIYNLDYIENYKGRIWIINSSNYEILEKIKQKYKIDILKKQSFKTEYKNFLYTITLIVK